MKLTPRLVAMLLSAVLYPVLAHAAWHDDPNVRKATALAGVTLLLWITEVAPLGVIALAIPLVATLSGLLPWKDALMAWADPVVFLFLGTFLLARALDKHGALDWILNVNWTGTASSSGAALALAVLVISGLLSTMQNNTAVTAMMLPVCIILSRRCNAPAVVLLALAWGSTFGGMAAPVGTAPNFIGYAAIKKLDPAFSFVSWMRVGIPVWIGTTLIGWSVLAIAAKLSRRPIDHPDIPVESSTSSSTIRDSQTNNPMPRRIALSAFALAALLWIIPGIIVSATEADHPYAIFVKTYLPESLVPIAIAWLLFIIPVAGRPLLDSRDFQTLDWDTLFLIAGGMCLGKVLETSGACDALAQTIVGTSLPPFLLMLALAGVTVLLSELTSNTATASVLVPLAAAIAPGLNMQPTQAVWLVALAASLGFALPISTPPNAIVYGSRLIPLRLMAATGVAIDILATLWLVGCVYYLGDR